MGLTTADLSLDGFVAEDPSTLSLSFTAWDMWCTGLAFNHDAAAHADDAINLRHDFHGAVVLPEWTCAASHSAGPSRSEPACWIAGTTPTVRGRFAVRPAGITNAVVGAWHLGPVLSPVAPTAVVFSNGVTHASGETNLADFAAFPLSSPIPAVVARSTDERWGWQVSELNGQATSGFVGTNGPSVAYSILGAPVAPWVDGTLANQNVWASALDFVITNACEGATTETNALAELTQFLFSGHGVVYDTIRGASRYLKDLVSGGNFFELSSYCSKANGNVVNCYDQATALTMSGRLLGIPSSLIYMRPFGYINKTNLGGRGVCNNPFHSDNSFHSSIVCPINAPNRSGFGNHMFVQHSSGCFDACAGPILGQWSLSEYVLNVIDTATTNTLFQTGTVFDTLEYPWVIENQ